MNPESRQRAMGEYPEIVEQRNDWYFPNVTSFANVKDYIDSLSTHIDNIKVAPAPGCQSESFVRKTLSNPLIIPLTRKESDNYDKNN